MANTNLKHPTISILLFPSIIYYYYRLKIYAINFRKVSELKTSKQMVGSDLYDGR